MATIAIYQTDRGRRWVFAGFVLLLGIVSIPLFSTVLPPIVDYPNHLARLHLISEGGNNFYAVRWAPLPNLAADLIVPPLSQVISLDLAGKLFLVLSFALIAGGTVWLNRIATGRWRMWSLLVFLLLYNRILLWGMINYLFGLGVAICGVALWLAMENRRGWQRALVSVFVALACFFSHIAALGVYSLAILGVEAAPTWSLIRARRITDATQRLAVAALQFVLPSLILLCFEPANTGGSISYGRFWRKADLLFSVFDNYSRPFDIACFALLIGLFGALAWRGRLFIAPRLRVALAVILAAYVLLPSQAFTGSGIDHRLPIALFLLLISATALSPPLPHRPSSHRLALVIGIGVIVIFGARMAMVEAVWLKAGRVYAASLAIIDSLPKGAKLAVAYPPRDIHAGELPMIHLATLAVARREAFVPTLFAYPTQQPLVLRPPFAALAAATFPTMLWAGFIDGEGAARAQLTPVLREYDFLLFADLSPFAGTMSPCLRAVRSTPRFQLFALRHDQGCF